MTSASAMDPMTAEMRIVIDARGGGFGHAMRGALLADAWVLRGHDVILCVLEGSTAHLKTHAEVHVVTRELRCAQLPDADLLVVDTFAEGFAGEWTKRELARYPRRALLARHRKDAPLGRHRDYDFVWLPYSAALDEWPAPLPDAQPVGIIAREVDLEQDPKSGALAVFDPGGRLDAGARATIERLATAARRPLRWLTRLSGRIEAAKLLCIGAGYGTFYELARRPLDVGFLPLSRRSDDQRARARMHQRAADSLEATLAWLRAEHLPRCLPTSHFATRHSLGALL